MRGILDTSGSSTLMVHDTLCTDTTTSTTGNDRCSYLEQPTMLLLVEGTTSCLNNCREDDSGDSAIAQNATSNPKKFPSKHEHSSTKIRSSSAGSGLTLATLVCNSSGRLDLNNSINSQQQGTTTDHFSSNGDEPMEEILHDIVTFETTTLDPRYNSSPSSLPCELEGYRNVSVHDNNPNEEKSRQIPDSIQIHRPRSLLSHFKMLRINDNDHGTKGRRQVSFHQVTIRRYPMIAGDNPSCENGPPVTLDWSFEELPSLDLDDFESMRRRTRRQKLHHLLLSYLQRQRILVGMGYTEQEIKQVEKEARTARFQRTLTRLSLPISKIEEMMQSLRRKIQRQCKATERQSKLEFNAVLMQLREEDAKRLTQ